MQAWNQFLHKQEAELGKETVDNWLKCLKVLHFDACNLYLEAEDAFQANWFEEHMRKKVASTFLNNNHKKIKVHLSIANAPAEAKNKKGKGKKRANAPETPSFSLTFDSLNPTYTLDQFVLTEENLLTYKLLKEIVSPQFKDHAGASQIGTLNPIYIYGGKGSGKTHLLMSMAHIFETQGLKTVYVRAEAFTDHVVSAIRAGEMSTFREAYRNIDVLIVDDVHVFSRKAATQEEFFHTFNTLHMEGKQILLAANAAPNELQNIEPRLVSRFEWGIVLNLKTLKPEEFDQLLKSRAKTLNFHIPPSVAEFLLENFKSTPKSLIKAFEALILRLHMDSNSSTHALNVTSTKTILSDLLIEEEKMAVTPEKIIHAVAEQYGIRTEDIMGKSQTRECAIPRKLAMHLCRQELKLPFMKIGDLFGRDHSTVMSSVKQIVDHIENNDREISDNLYSITKKLQLQ